MIRTRNWALIAVVLGTAGCGGGQSGQSISTGMTAVLLSDGPIQVVNDNRTIVSLEIDISRVTLDSAEDETEADDFGEDAGDVVVFNDAANPLTIDLLTLADSSALLGLLNVPVGTYDEAKLTVIAARAIFEDDPGVLVELVPGSEEDGPAGVFEFEFEPKVTVSAEGTTVATIDFVPVVTLVGASYVLTHDDDTDESGENEGDAELEFTGAITSISDDLTTITIEGVAEPIDISGAQFEADDLVVDPASLVVGQVVEVDGFLDPALNVIIATEVEIEGDDD